MAANMAFESALEDCLKKTVKLGRIFCLNFHLDASIGQIPHPAGDLESPGDVFARRPKAHALDTSLKQNTTSSHGESQGGYRAASPLEPEEWQPQAGPQLSDAKSLSVGTRPSCSVFVM